MPGFDITIATLSKSRNQAATAALIAALDGDASVRDGVLRALVERRSIEGHEHVVARWHQLTPDQQELLQLGRGRITAALRNGLNSRSRQLFLNAYEIATAVDEFDVMPTLITLAENRDQTRANAAVQLALRLASKLEKMTHASVDARDQQNIDILRHSVLECLQRSVERYRQHNRQELIEAYVGLAGPHSEFLRSILDSPHHACFPIVVEILSRSDSPAVVNLLTTLFLQPNAPSVVRSIVGKRTDPTFTAALLALPFNWADEALLKTLGRIQRLDCVAAERFSCEMFGGDYQVTAMQLTAVTGVADRQKLGLAGKLLRVGAPAARLVACEVLSMISGQTSNELVMRALEDEMPEIQAAAVRQLRNRHIPGSMAKLLELVDSPHEEVALAASEAMPEFSVAGFLSRYDSLDGEQRRSGAAVVARVDQAAAEHLREELQDPAPRRRLRAIEVVDVMGLAPELADALVERLEDDDHMVRAAAADALHACTGEDVRQALLAALDDRSVAVQSSARASLEHLGARPKV